MWKKYIILSIVFLLAWCGNNTKNIDIQNADDISAIKNNLTVQKDNANSINDKENKVNSINEKKNKLSKSMWNVSERKKLKKQIEDLKWTPLMYLSDCSVAISYPDLYKMCVIEKQKAKKLYEEQQKKEVKKMQERFKKIQEWIKNFKIEDCEKYAKYHIIKLPPKNVLEKMPTFEKERFKNIWTKEEQKRKFIEKCKIWYALNIKKDCNILDWELKVKCLQVKKDIQFYKRLQKNYNEYSRFDLRQVVDPTPSFGY